MSRTTVFSVNRMNPTPLAKQVAEGYKRLMKSGQLKAGSVLPPRAAIAAELGISEYAVRKGLDELVVEGHLVSRAGIGHTVVSKRPKSLFASVLHVTVSHYDSYSSRVMGRLVQQELVKAGYAVSSLRLDDQTPRSLRLLRKALQARPDFVILGARVWKNSPVLRLLANSEIPCLQRGNPEDLAREFATAFEALAATCKAGGVHSVAQFNFSGRPTLDAASALERVGVYVEQVDCAATAARTLEEVQLAAQAAMRTRLRQGALPDLLLFNDDYLALGALPVLLEAGIRIPKDIRIVTLANRGFGPVFTKTLARLEVDPERIGRQLASAIIAWIRTGRSSSIGSLIEFVPGETFPESLKCR